MTYYVILANKHSWGIQSVVEYSGMFLSQHSHKEVAKIEMIAKEYQIIYQIQVVIFASDSRHVALYAECYHKISRAEWVND